MISNRSRWKPLKPGDSAVGVCTCASCMRAIDRGEDVTCNGCVAEACETAYANGRLDARNGDVDDEC